MGTILKMEDLFTMLAEKGGAIEKKVCIFCKKPITGFKDALSKKEYSISGLCQECQDMAFAEDE